MLAREPRARTGIRIQSKRFRGCRRPRLPAFQETASQMTRKTVTIPVPHAMITWAISYVTGANRNPHTRDHSREHFSPAVRADGSPITWLKV